MVGRHDGDVLFIRKNVIIDINSGSKWRQQSRHHIPLWGSILALDLAIKRINGGIIPESSFGPRNVMDIAAGNGNGSGARNGNADLIFVNVTHDMTSTRGLSENRSAIPVTLPKLRSSTSSIKQRANRRL